MNPSPQRVALVTGAARGIGLAVAKRFLADGWRVALLDIERDLLHGALAALAKPDDTLALHCDVSNADAVAAAMAELSNGFGRLDALVNNAGIAVFAPLLETSEQDWNRVLSVNLTGPFLCTKAAAPLMREGGGGAIVNITSIVTHGGWSGLASYATSKGAAGALTRALARELGPFGIRVNAVSPGAFPTAAEEIHENPAAYDKFVLDHQALKRRGAPEELAAVVSFLAGPESSFVTGQTIEVNGGWVMV